MQKLFIFALIAFACVSSVFGIKCYQCTGKEECNNPSIQTCPSYVKGCATAAVGIAPYIARGCADNGAGGDVGLSGCINTVYSGSKMTVCECTDKDLCNDKNIDPPKNVAAKTHFGRRQMAVEAKAKDVWMSLISKH